MAMSAKKKPVLPPKATFVSHVRTNGDVHNARAKAGESCFYITLEDHNEATIEVDLLPGEILISQVEKVTQYVAYSNENTGHIGTLFVTNYKVSFVTLLTDRSPSHDKYCGRRNRLIGQDDVALTSISDIYNVAKGRKKKLTKGSLSLTMGPISCLELHCKDFRIHSFSFENCDRGEVNKMVNTIVHHSFLSRSDLLFAFYFEADRLSPRSGEFRDLPPDFSSAEDWSTELARLKVTQSFRVTDCNTQYALSTELPECFVVPSTLKDSDIFVSRAELSRRCIPIWCYSYANGCALVRLAYGLTQDITETMVQTVKAAHPMTRKPQLIDLGDGRLPLLRDLQSSYERLREQCMPSTNKDLWSSDLTWYSLLEECRWLQFVSVTLQIAYEIVEKLSFENRSVVIREKDGATDFSPVVSSLAQLMMDQDSRTIAGFQRLVEKEWVSLGHRFTTRCGIIFQTDAEESPLFLLFLDCVWQLLQQFPSAFEFSEIYLTSLWDSIGLAMFRNFIFDSPYSRSFLGAPNRPSQSPRLQQKTPDGRATIMTVWDWEKQFHSEDIALFTNPLYVAHEQVCAWQWRDSQFDKAYRKFTRRASDSDLKSGSLSPKQTIDARKLWRLRSTDILALAGKEVLRPGFKAPQIKLWEHCYLRWLTPIQIVGGGMPSEFLAQSALMEEIRALQEKIRGFESTAVADRKSSKRLKVKVTPAVMLPDNVSSSYPFSPTRPPNLSIVPAVSPSLQRISLNDDSTTSESDDFVILYRSDC